MFMLTRMLSPDLGDYFRTWLRILLSRSDNHIVGAFKLTIYHNVDITYIVNIFFKEVV